MPKKIPGPLWEFQVAAPGQSFFVCTTSCGHQQHFKWGQGKMSSTGSSGKPYLYINKVDRYDSKSLDPHNSTMVRIYTELRGDELWSVVSFVPIILSHTHTSQTHSCTLKPFEAIKNLCKLFWWNCYKLPQSTPRGFVNAATAWHFFNSFW